MSPKKIIINESKQGEKPSRFKKGTPAKRQRDNMKTPRNTPSVKPHKHKKGD